MSKKDKEKPAAPQATTFKTPEQIAAEIAGNSMKPVIAAVAVFIAIGIALMVINSNEESKKKEMAEGYEKLDTVILRHTGTPSYMRTTESAEKLDEYSNELTTLKTSGLNSDAVVDAVFFEGIINFQQKKYGEAAEKFKAFYTSHADRLPLADFARLNAVNAYVNAGTPDDIEKALAIASTVSASDDDIKDKLKYQEALCNVLLGEEVRVKKATTILEELSVAKNGQEARAISGQAKSLLTLINRSNPEDLKILVSGFPASMVKATPAEPTTPVPGK